MAANAKPKNNILVDVHIGHTGLCHRGRAEVKLSTAGTDGLLQCASPPNLRIARDPLSASQNSHNAVDDENRTCNMPEVQ